MDMSEGKINAYIIAALETAQEATDDSEERLSIAAAILTKKLRNETKFSAIRALLKFAETMDASPKKSKTQPKEGKDATREPRPPNTSASPDENPILKAALERRDQFATPLPAPGPSGIPKAPAKSVPAWHMPYRKRHPSSEE